MFLVLRKRNPLIIVPQIINVEFLSYVVKVFTLSNRLFANMMCYHTSLKFIAGFA